MDWLKRHQRGDDLEEPLRARAEVSLPWPDGVSPEARGAAAAFLDEHGLNVCCAGTWHRPDGTREDLPAGSDGSWPLPPASAGLPMVSFTETQRGGPAEVLVDGAGERVPARYFVRSAPHILGLHHGEGRLKAWWWTGVPGR